MADRLVVLASSRRPDVYFNIIGHNARQGVTQFVLAAVGNLPDETPDQQAFALQQNLTRFVSELMNSIYLLLPASVDQAGVPLALPLEMKSFFEHVNWGRLQFTYLSVQEGDLTEFLREQRAAGAAFDVTACKNSVLAGAVAWLVSRGGSPIYTMEIKKQQVFGEADLLPYLEPSQYAYRDLSASRLIRGATRRVNAGTIHKRRFWFISAAVAIAVGLLAFLVPAQFATPILAAAATFATIMSGVAILVRNPDDQ
ncbi:MAG: hypothetical protein JWN70_3731 [Planctomycetaceae bacterium]|nr:hypothetical protein [Planctomycetaceae bacterium]